MNIAWNDWKWSYWLVNPTLTCYRGSFLGDGEKVYWIIIPAIFGRVNYPLSYCLKELSATNFSLCRKGLHNSFLCCLCSNGLYMPHGRNEAGFKTRQLSQHPVIAASWEYLLLKCGLNSYLVISTISKSDLPLHMATCQCQLFDGIWAPGRVLGSLTALLLGQWPTGYMKPSHQLCQ